MLKNLYSLDGGISFAVQKNVIFVLITLPIKVLKPALKMHFSSVRHLVLLSYQNSILRSSVYPKRFITTSIAQWNTRKILDDSDENTRKTKKDITDLPEKEIYPEYTQSSKGVVYDKKPFKYECIEGKAYVWCSCGRSHNQVQFAVKIFY